MTFSWKSRACAVQSISKHWTIRKYFFFKLSIKIVAFFFDKQNNFVIIIQRENILNLKMTGQMRRFFVERTQLKPNLTVKLLFKRTSDFEPMPSFRRRSEPKSSHSFQYKAHTVTTAWSVWNIVNYRVKRDHPYNQTVTFVRAIVFAAISFSPCIPYSVWQRACVCVRACGCRRLWLCSFHSIRWCVTVMLVAAVSA